MLARAGQRAGLGAVKPHAFRHSFTSTVPDAAGAGACLPENSGGTGGFAYLKEVLVGPPVQAREEMRAWASEDYAPERFNLDAANAAVAAI
jgi:Plasmid pRiA4b ORF-3-like protein